MALLRPALAAALAALAALPALAAALHGQVTSENCAPPEEALKFVYRSPAVVGRHEKAVWLGMFDDQGVVQDPYGAVYQQGPEALSSFYDAFIAVTNVTFAPHYDIATCSSVVRVVDIVAVTPNGCQTSQRTAVVYDLAADAPLRLRGLTALWSLTQRVEQLMAQPCGAAAGAQMGWLVLKHLGLRGSLRYAAGMGNVGDEGRKVAAGALASWAAGGAEGFAAALSPRAALALRLADGDEAPARGAEAVAEALDRWGWVASPAAAPEALAVASGDRLTMEVALRPRGAGASEATPGLMLFDFKRHFLRGLSIEAVTIFQGARPAPAELRA